MMQILALTPTQCHSPRQRRPVLSLIKMKYCTEGYSLAGELPLNVFPCIFLLGRTPLSSNVVIAFTELSLHLCLYVYQNPFVATNRAQEPGNHL